MLHQDTLVRLCQARDLLRRTGDECLSVRQVAGEVGMSPFHFIRLFRAVFGETPKQCQLRARMERAKNLLLLTDTPVTEICLEVGSASLGTFSTSFTRRVGMAPSVYRASVRRLAASNSEIPRQLFPGCMSLMVG